MWLTNQSSSSMKLTHNHFKILCATCLRALQLYRETSQTHSYSSLAALTEAFTTARLCDVQIKVDTAK